MRKPEPQLAHALGDHPAPAHQNRDRQSLVEHRLHRAQHALVLALGVGHTLRRAAGGMEHGMHQRAGAEREALEVPAIGGAVGERPPRHAALHRRLGDRRRDLEDQPRIEGFRDDVVGAEQRRRAAVRRRDRLARLHPREPGQRLHRGDLHPLVDRARADIERAAKDEGKDEHVVDLVRIVRAPGRDDRIRPRRQHQLGHDLGLGVGECEDQRAGGEFRQPLGLQHARRREAEEHVHAVEHLLEPPRRRFSSVTDEILALEPHPPAMHHALDVGERDVPGLEPHRDQKVDRGERRRARARGDELRLLQPLLLQEKPVAHRRRHRDRGAVLVVVKNRDAHPPPQRRLDREALGRLDVLEVDRAERRLQRRHHLDEALGVGGVHLDVEHVDAGELLEEDRLALHHRLRRQRPDIAEPEHRAAVGDHRHQVAARGIVVGGGRIGRDRERSGRHPRRIGEGQVVLRRHPLGRLDGELSRLRQPVIVERFLANGLVHRSLLP